MTAAIKHCPQPDPPELVMRADGYHYRTEDEMNMQALVDGLSAQWQRERAETQLTLGKLIAALEAMPSGACVANLCNPASYRGYYTDLYFEEGHGTRLASGLLSDCKAAMGQVYTGYKGGEYVMGALTPLWVATYGSCGKKLMAVHEGGGLETAEDE
ncbi:MAG TPA: hypothetical protein VN039_02610 [Nitrospira sp.]|nr:hypothetical protein [Nitrospira sp.]